MVNAPEVSGLGFLPEDGKEFVDLYSSPFGLDPMVDTTPTVLSTSSSGWHERQPLVFPVAASPQGTIEITSSGSRPMHADIIVRARKIGFDNLTFIL